MHFRPLFSAMVAASAAVLGLSACAPKALYFHESTKVAFSADYNSSDTQPLATSLGYKRRIVAVVPAQERVIPNGGSEKNGTNEGEALSLVSKFNVRASGRDGIVITNNFASGMAARTMTRSVGSPEALNVLMHTAPIFVTAAGETSTGKPATEVVNERLAKIMSRRTTEVPSSRRKVDLDGSGTLKISRQQADAAEKKNALVSAPLPKKADVPASSRSVDLTPAGEAEIKKR